jgi:hypothetical protein
VDAGDEVRVSLPDLRELRAVRWEGLTVLSVHDRAHAGACTSGPLALRAGDLGAVRAALADLDDGSET